MIGILCGLESEAELVRQIPGVIVGCSASNPAQGRVAVQELLKQGATRLISFGLAGGLSPDLPAGALVVADSVHMPRTIWDCDRLWNERFLSHLPGARWCGSVWGSETILVKPEQKREIFLVSGCLAGDMESHIVAEAAVQAGKPFQVLRVVVDTASMKLPPAACLPLDPQGKVHLPAILLSLVNQPSQLPSLITLGHNAARAKASLKRAAETLGAMEHERPNPDKKDHSA